MEYLMRDDLNRRSYAAFETIVDPDRLARCPYCEHWSFDGFAVLKEINTRSGKLLYSVYCLKCDSFGPSASNLETAIEEWNRLDVHPTRKDQKKMSDDDVQW